MRYKELKYIDTLTVNKLKKRQPPKIHTYETTDMGLPHPLWSCMTIAIGSCMEWQRMTPAERGMIYRCAAILHEHNIPYSYYTKYLVRMSKQGIVRKAPLFITRYKQKTNAQPPSIFAEYLSMMDFLITKYRQYPNVIKITDKVYTAYPDAYVLGALKYIHTVIQIEEALEHKSINEILLNINNNKDIYTFWDSLGTAVTNAIDDQVPEFDLSEGISAQGSLKILQKEIRIRLGKESGMPIKELDKYFTKSNRLNKRGLGVISGTRLL